MAVTVGAVYVDVLPSARDFVKNMLEQILPEADKAGEEIGKRVGEALGKAAGKQAKDGIEKGVENADTEADGAKKGKETGGAFARAFKAELEAALRSLPNVDIDGDNTGALAEVAEVRAALKELSDKEIGVDIEPEEALRAIAEIRADLLAIQDRSIDVDFDINSATASLGKLEDKITRSFQDSQGSFARSLRSAIDNAVRSLPEIKPELDISDADRELGNLRARLEELGRKRIDIDISTPKLLAELAKIEAALGTIEGPHTIRMQADLDAARAALAKFVTTASDGGGQAGGAFMQRMKAEILKAAQSLPQIRPDVDATPAEIEVARLREQLATLSARIGVDVDAASAFAQLATLKAVAEALDRDDVNIDVRVDLRNAIAEMTALAAASRVAESAIDGAVGNTAVGKVSRFQLILAAVAVLLPIIAAAVTALAAVFALVVAPVLAIAAGVDGIKKSFSELAPQIEAVKQQVSEAFEKGLEPTVGRLQQAIPQLTDDLVGTANAVTGVADKLSEVATRSDNLQAIETNFQLINKAISDSEPSLELFLTNTLKLTTVGLQGMQNFGAGMTEVGLAWQGIVDRLIASGAAEQAVQALFQIITNLLGLVGGLTEFGTVLGAAFGPAVAAALSLLTSLFSNFAQALDSLPQPLQSVASIATTVGLAMLIMGGRIVTAVGTMRGALIGAGTAVVATMRTVYASTIAAGASITGLGVASRIAAPGIALVAGAVRTLWAALGGGIGIVITGIVIALSALGTSQADATAKAEAYRVSTEKLTQALQEANGAIDAHILRLAQEALASTGAQSAADTLGFSLGGMVSTVAKGGPAFDGLVAKLQELAAQDVTTGTAVDDYGRVVAGASEAQVEQKKSAQTLLDALLPLRQTFADAAKDSGELARTLVETGGSMVSGEGDAKRLEDAFATLKDKMSDVKQIGDALYLTMIQLTGQSIPLGLAQGALGEAVRNTEQAFKDYAEATKKSGDKLLDTTGKINVASEAGYKLTQSLDAQAKASYNSAAAAFDAAGGMSNIQKASADASREVQFSREAFIKMVGQFGITGTAAQELADRYGLIPELVVTELVAKNLPQVSKDILQMNQLIQNLPSQKIINVGVPSQETISALDAIGIKVQKLADGTYTIDLSTQQAKDKWTAFVNAIEHPKPPPQTPVGADTAPGQQDVDKFKGNIHNGPHADVPVGADGKPLTQQLPGIQGQVTDPQGGTPAMPVQLDPAQVPQQAQAVASTVLGTVATMPINPIKGSGWDVDLAGIQASVLATVGQMPIDAMKSVNFDAQIQYIKTVLAQGIAGTLPIDPVMSPNWPAALQAIKNTLITPPYTVLFIDVARAPTWATSLAAITGPLSLPPYTLLFIDVARAPTWATSLAAIVGPLSLPPYSLLMLDPAKSPTWQPIIDAIRLEFVNAPLVWQVVADVNTQVLPALAYVFDLVAQSPLIWLVFADLDTQLLPALDYVWQLIGTNPLVWVLIAETSIIVQQLIDIANWVAQNPLYWQIIPVFSGFGGGGGGGGGGGAGAGTAFIARGAIIMMAAGGAIGKALTPMRNDVATVVPPNTWRVVGDRPAGDEAFIPLINARRSHRILEYAASSMGRTILPMASGGFTTQSAGMIAGGQGEDWATATPEGGSSWHDRQAPLIGQVVGSPNASAADLADEVMFRLRVADYGGLHNVRR